MTPDQIAWVSAGCAILAVLSGFLGHVLTARKNKLEQENRLLTMQNELIEKIQAERNWQDQQMSSMRASFELRINEALAGEAAARQYVGILLPLVPPPQPDPPAGYKP